MSETATKPDTAKLNTLLGAAAIDPSEGGANLLVYGKLAAQRNGSTTYESPGDKDRAPSASCNVEYWGGSCRIALEPYSDSHRKVANARAGVKVLFSIRTEGRDFNVGKFSVSAYVPEGKATLLHIQEVS